MRVDTNLLIQTSIASCLVIFGVVTKNSSEQLGFPNHPIGKPVGMGISINKPNKLMFILPSVGIVIAVMMMKTYMVKKQTPPVMFPLIFALSWIILGLNVGNHLSGNQKYIGIFASLLVLLSMMKILPYQRTNNVVDGPGMPMFVIAWVILSILNSSR